MYFEYEQTTSRHSWPATTDMTMSDTYPRHIDFQMTQQERESHMGLITCAQSVQVGELAA